MAEGNLYRGYDAGCGKCQALAKAIQDSGLGIRAMSLRDPQMVSWRAEVFGEHAPGTPTLVETTPNSVNAWTGPRLGVALMSKAGIRNSWHLMRLVGELRSNQGPEPEALTRRGRGLSRSGFLQGITGAAVGAAVLTNMPVASAAGGSTGPDWLAALKLNTPREMPVESAQGLFRQELRDSSLQRVLRNHNAQAVGLEKRIENAIRQAKGNGPDGSDMLKVVNHAVTGGGTLHAMVYIDDEVALSIYKLRGNRRGNRVFVRLLRKVDNGSAEILLELEDGELFSRPTPERAAGR